ncbi:MULTISPECIES: hypothetical protein [unclassified Nostoc]|uniref:hypothetical protein n=1 Tax=unclassified Nostoc TaxID=2593658 RepID=UPI002AD549CE|nr:hypothetical protein [Nostoc sp. DedQUE03]MDZ7972414.1 hypothetical protein [Nostoc sp. DedQUE03]MDZ8046672.1 hypothetical protein [Nostoc sp. DedQUE02]
MSYKRAGKALAVLRDRIIRLGDSGKPEASAEAVLKYLRELKRPYLTEFEERLLSFIKLECRINVSSMNLSLPRAKGGATRN